MSDRALSPYSLTVAHARSAARRASRLCLLALVGAALLCATLPAMADFIQANVPKLTASDPVGSAQKLGFSVAVSSDGNTAIVGGPFDNGGAGAAWIFTRGGGTWTQQQKLTASDATGNAELGWSVALSADGNTAIVGGPGDNSSIGAAWVFTRSSNTWSQQGTKLTGATTTGTTCATQGVVGQAELGYSVAISRDGNTAIVGGWADNSSLGAAWVFSRSNATWSPSAVKLCGSGATDTVNIMQGFSVAVSDDGGTAIIGGPNDGAIEITGPNGKKKLTDVAWGAAWVFRLNGGVWRQQGDKLVGTTAANSESQQGFAVALSGDGSTAIIGGPGEETSGTGTSGAIDATGTPETTVHMSDGAAWVWTRSGAQWTQQQKLVGASAASSNPGKGFSVTLGGGGNTAILGGPTDNANTGAAWVFVNTSGTWKQQSAKLVGTGAVGAGGQASSVALSSNGTTAIIGGALDQNATGAAWVFVVQGAALTVSLTGTGAVTSSPSGIACPATTCSADFGDATNVSLTATPVSGWQFSGWSGACSGSASCTVTMTAAESVTATFQQVFTLTVSDSGSGTITSTQSNIDCTGTCNASFGSGTMVTLTAIPGNGNIFTGWSGACSGTGSCTVTMSAAENVTAQFALGPSRTFVSSEAGDDSNPCTRTLPCLTFAGAYLNTAAGGEIDVLDPGDYGPLTVITSLTIDGGGGQLALATASQTPGITITANQSNDVVVLRHLSLQGGLGNDSNPGSAGTIGINIVSALRVALETIDVTGFGSGGIVIAPSTGTMNVKIQDTSASGNPIGLLSKPTGGAAAHVTIDHSSFDNNVGDGIRIDSTGGGMTEAAITGTSASVNGGNGINAVAGAYQSIVSIKNGAIARNSGVGVQANGANAGVSLGTTTLDQNTGGATSVVNGGVTSYGNNSIVGSAGSGFTATATPQ
jgi:FG-GAP repeat/Divergent InlB B-repeat domain